MSSVELRDVSMSYGRGPSAVLALDGISLSVPDGEFACIVGSSGCGKSTLLLIAAGLMPPTSGEVLVDGRLEMEPGADRGMVFQGYSLYPWLTVRRNIEFGLRLKHMAKAERDRVTDELLDAMGLKAFADAHPKALSGGMKQRVAIARALANDPEVLLMDEPFGALDAQTRQIMQELLTSIWQRYRKTVLFVTHDIEEAVFLADRIYIMTSRPGRIRTILPVNLARPRTFETLASDEFSRIRREVIGIIHEESLRATQYELEHGGAVGAA